MEKNDQKNSGLYNYEEWDKRLKAIPDDVFDKVINSDGFNRRIAGELMDIYGTVLLPAIRNVAGSDEYTTVMMLALKLASQKILGEKARVKSFTVYSATGAEVGSIDFSLIVFRDQPMSYAMVTRFSMFMVGRDALVNRLKGLKNLPKSEVLIKSDYLIGGGLPDSIILAMANQCEQVIEPDNDNDIYWALALQLRFTVRQIAKKEPDFKMDALIGMDKMQRVLIAKGCKFDIQEIIDKEVAKKAFSSANALFAVELATKMAKNYKDFSMTKPTVNQLLKSMPMGESDADRRQRINNRKRVADKKTPKDLPRTLLANARRIRQTRKAKKAADTDEDTDDDETEYDTDVESAESDGEKQLKKEKKKDKKAEKEKKGKL